MDKKWVFEKPEDLDQWRTGADSDHKEGYSKCSLTMSSTGHGLFSGNLSNDVSSYF